MLATCNFFLKGMNFGTNKFSQNSLRSIFCRLNVSQFIMSIEYNSIFYDATFLLPFHIYGQIFHYPIFPILNGSFTDRETHLVDDRQCVERGTEFITQT